MVEKRITPYDQIGEEMLAKLVDAFYLRVGKHPDLIPIFPEDLTETVRKQKQFLTQFLGGPSLYTDEHGHPRMRARHLPHEITPIRRDAWLSCMNDAMDSIQFTGELRDVLFARLTMTAQHMTNTDESQTGDLP